MTCPPAGVAELWGAARCRRRSALDAGVAARPRREVDDLRAGALLEAGGERLGSRPEAAQGVARGVVPLFGLEHLHESLAHPCLPSLRSSCPTSADNVLRACAHLKKAATNSLGARNARPPRRKRTAEAQSERR